MTAYTQENMLRIAKRFNNPKRSYLLVNPLQAKHLPAIPGEALGMMGALGDKLAASYPGCRLVIGFAETATAIGAAVAARLGADCRYLHTTREGWPQAAGWVEFLEEHSHAAEQRLAAERLADWLGATDTLIFVDDEISTGKTLVNMIGQLREIYPGLAGKRLVAASLLNRLTAADEERLRLAGVEREYLLRLAELDPAAAVADLAVHEAPAAAAGAAANFSCQSLAAGPLPDPRVGVAIGDYTGACEGLAAAFISKFATALPAGSRIVVLGTEECMYPALVLGRQLEGRGCDVRCHATTRSPIGICGAAGYPVRSGAKLGSFYEAGRSTYIYNMAPCDVLIVVSDTPWGDLAAARQLAAAWPGWQRLYFIGGGQNVWYL